MDHLLEVGGVGLDEGGWVRVGLRSGDGFRGERVGRRGNLRCASIAAHWVMITAGAVPVAIDDAARGGAHGRVWAFSLLLFNGSLH